MDNPQITILTQGGNIRPWRSAFGEVRQDINKPHYRLDLFVQKGSNVYACLDGEVVGVEEQSGYGKILIIKITDLEVFKSSVIDYELYYIKSKRAYDKSKYDVYAYNFNEKEGIKTSEEVFLRYAHLDSFEVSEGDKVSAGDVVGKSGVSGVKNGTYGPHLHFEISSCKYPSGFENRYNPAFYVAYKNEKELSSELFEIQLEIKKSGKIK